MMDWIELAYLIKIRVGFWLKGWCPECPFSPVDLSRSLEAVCNWNKKQTVSKSLEWKRPPQNVWKWNVDGSSRGKPGAASIGGVLRNDCGEIAAKFAVSIGVKDSDEAEFLAIVFALEQSLDKEWRSNGTIIVESVSRNALAWVDNSGACPWSMRFACNKLKNILLSLKNVMFTHVNREANCLADELAKSGSSMAGSWIHWY
jgi:ribonuclease HI